MNIFWMLVLSDKVVENFQRLGFDALVAVDGDGSLEIAHEFAKKGLPVVGVPLPLFSYGGSSVLTTYLVAGILLSIRLRRFAR